MSNAMFIEIAAFSRWLQSSYSAKLYATYRRCRESTTAHCLSCRSWRFKCTHAYTESPTLVFFLQKCYCRWNRPEIVCECLRMFANVYEFYNDIKIRKFSEICKPKLLCCDCLGRYRLIITRAVLHFAITPFGNVRWQRLPSCLIGK